MALVLSSCQGRVKPNFRIRAVNLGGWLVTEGWIKPSLFDGIVNRDFLDGTALQFKSVTTGKGGGSVVVANRTDASAWETFRLWRINETAFNFRVFNRQFIGLDTNGNGIDIVAVSKAPGNSEIFEILRDDDDKNRVRIKAPNGYYLQAKTEEQVTADSRGSNGWGGHDPSVFVMKMVGRLEGPEKAPQLIREHWKTFIVKKDFKFISQSGFNAVRIPIGWWIASDPTPPLPYVAGSLNVLDNAFLWAEYAKSLSLYAVELINEPLSPRVTLSSLIKYYKAGYEAVRKHTSTAFVMISNRLGPMKPREFFPMANGLHRSVIDVHYYNLFEDIFVNMTVQQNINFVYNNRSSQLNYVTTFNGLLTFVGEWVAEWEVNGATKEEYQRFVKAQLKVYERANFGWAYWTLKNVNKHLSLEWMIRNGYIKLYVKHTT